MRRSGGREGGGGKDTWDKRTRGGQRGERRGQRSLDATTFQLAHAASKGIDIGLHGRKAGEACRRGSTVIGRASHMWRFHRVQTGGERGHCRLQGGKTRESGRKGCRSSCSRGCLSRGSGACPCRVPEGYNECSQCKGNRVRSGGKGGGHLPASRSGRGLWREEGSNSREWAGSGAGLWSRGSGNCGNSEGGCNGRA